MPIVEPDKDKNLRRDNRLKSNYKANCVFPKSFLWNLTVEHPTDNKRAMNLYRKKEKEQDIVTKGANQQ